jgi:hypothetical protein
MGCTLHTESGSGYRNVRSLKDFGYHRLKKSGAPLGKVPVGISLVFELRLDRGIRLFRSQALELARVRKVLGKFSMGF